MGAVDWDDERRQAGRALAERLLDLRNAAPIVVGLARGGVPAAYEVARALDAPLQLCLVGKIGLPHWHDVTIAAVGEGGALYADEALLRRHHVDAGALAELVRTKRAELEEQAQVFRRGDEDAGADAFRSRTLVVVDDVIVSGASAMAALEVVRRQGPRRIILAAPIGATDAIARLRAVADDVVCVHLTETTARLDGVYRTRKESNEVTDDDVIELVSRIRAARKQRFSEVWSPWQ